MELAQDLASINTSLVYVPRSTIFLYMMTANAFGLGQ